MWKQTQINPKYEVNEIGEVRTIATGFIKKQRTDRYGYKVVALNCGNGKQKFVTVHRLVAQAFVPNPDNLPCVNHKDENKTNNNADNLEWCTVAYNNRYGTHIEKCAAAKRKAVIGTKDGEEVHFDSAREAGEVLGIPWRYIGDAIHHRGKRKRAGGYEWKFA